jgi:hypothetical protein
MQEEISNWLSGSRNYAVGVQLYLKSGKDPLLLNLFREPIETEFKHKKLASSLQSLLNGTEKAIVQQKTSTAKYLGNHNNWPPESSDEILTALREQWRPLYGKLTNLQARIHDIALSGKKSATKQMQACQMAGEIIDLDEQIRSIYSKKDYYLKHHKLPDEPFTVPIQIGDDKIAWSRRENLKRYLRTLANQLSRHKISDAKRPKWLQKWNDHVAEIRELNKRFKRPDNEGIPPR